MNQALRRIVNDLKAWNNFPFVYCFGPHGATDDILKVSTVDDPKAGCVEVTFHDTRKYMELKATIYYTKDDFRIQVQGRDEKTRRSKEVLMFLYNCQGFPDTEAVKRLETTRLNMEYSRLLGTHIQFKESLTKNVNFSVTTTFKNIHEASKKYPVFHFQLMSQLKGGFRCDIS